MNKWIGMGRLTRDPDIRMYGEQQDKKMARFTVAVDRRGKHEEGQQSADFIGCVVYGKLADFVDSYLRQGTKVALTGRIQTGSYRNQEGQKVYTTDVFVEEIEFAESKRATEGNASQAAPNTAKAEAPKAGADGFVNLPDDGIEEDLPFA